MKNITSISNSNGEEFKIGDVVKLKGGNIRMVINHIIQTPSIYMIASQLNQPLYQIYCKYEKNGKVVDGEPFSVESLEKA